jgi:hypothetical protein
MEPGLSILNVGEGDTKLSFDPDKPVERERAARIVTDMLRRGYAILIQIGEKDGEAIYRRAKRFDPKSCEYIIEGLSEAEEEEIASFMAGGQKKRTYRRVPAASTPAIAVARTARGCTAESWE